MSIPAQSLPRRHILTVNDYHRMGEAGILPPEARVELIEGEVIDMAPIGSHHAGIVTRLNRLLVLAVSTQAIVSIQNPMILDGHSEPQTDISLLKPRDDFYTLAHPKASEVLLLVEVADSSLHYDRDIKIPLFARHGIPEVWLIDLEKRRLTRFLDPGESGYASSEDVDVSNSLRPLALPDIDLELSHLFDCPGEP